MSKKSKGLVLESTPSYGVGVYEDAKTRMRHQALMVDYQELQKETDAMRSKLEAAKQRKLALAAEVKFLRRRHKYLVKSKAMALLSSQEQNLVSATSSLKQTKRIKEQLLVNRKEASHQRLPPPVPESKIVKRKKSVGKDVAARISSPVVDQQHHKRMLHSGKEPDLTPISVLNHKGRINVRREAFPWNPALAIDLNQKERMQTSDASLRKSIAPFDLNQDTSPCTKEASQPTRAPIFDLNEISTGEEDFQSSIEAAKLEEAKKSFIRGLNEEQQNDLKLSICRNAGEGPSRVGKRKISWQDPVALRV